MRFLGGGYFLKIDRLGDGEKGFRAGFQQFVHVFPSERDVTRAQTAWLTDCFDAAQAALCRGGISSSDNSYAAYLDVDSWGDQHLIQEITRNPDAYRYMTFLTKPRHGRIRLGPAWDYDRAMRTNTDDEWVGRAARPTGWIWGGEP